MAMHKYILIIFNYYYFLPFINLKSSVNICIYVKNTFKIAKHFAFTQNVFKRIHTFATLARLSSAFPFLSSF